MEKGGIPGAAMCGLKRASLDRTTMVGARDSIALCRQRRTWPLGLCVAIAMLVVAAGCSRTPEERYARFLAAGKKQLDQSDYNRAALNFRNAIQLQPKG